MSRWSPVTGLSDRVVLEVDALPGANDDAAFVLQTELETTDSLDRSYVLAERGQYAGQAFEILPDGITDPIADVEFNRREGYHIDGGAGSDAITISATRGVEEVTQWGDGSADGEPTQYDVSPINGDLVDDDGADRLNAKVDVLRHWLNETRSDSGGQTRLHIRHHTDGSYSSDPGVFGEPITVAIQEHTISKEDHTEIEVTLEVVRTAQLPDMEAALEGAQDAIDATVDQLAEYTPDW